MADLKAWLRRNLPLMFDKENAVQVLEIPIFPLHAVLFPGGVLPLRVFEQRYMDMVKACLRQERPFGVCLIREGEEVGTPAVPEPVGCLARIGAWDMQQLGVLSLKAVGLQRYAIQHQRVGAEGLIRAEVRPIAAEAAQPVPPSLQPCATVLRHIAEQMGEGNFEPPPLFEDAAWVGYRLAEVLPLKPRVKQSMLEMNDSLMRLEILKDFLLRQGLA